jgi:hypothetical protein
MIGDKITWGEMTSRDEMSGDELYANPRTARVIGGLDSSFTFL